VCGKREKIKMKEKKTVKTILFLTETMNRELESVASATGQSKQELIRAYISTCMYSQRKAEELLQDFIKARGGLDV
jgi:hypothetical protein